VRHRAGGGTCLNVPAPPTRGAYLREERTVRRISRPSCPIATYFVAGLRASFWSVPKERRPKWTAEEEAALITKVEAEGGRRCDGCATASESLLYSWRSVAKRRD
jgi:hypothetical protein